MIQARISRWLNAHSTAPVVGARPLLETLASGLRGERFFYDGDPMNAQQRPARFFQQIEEIQIGFGKVALAVTRRF
jgi:hypothetical protein